MHTYMGVLSSAWWPGGRTTANPFCTWNVRKKRQKGRFRAARTEALVLLWNYVVVLDGFLTLPRFGRGKNIHMNGTETGWCSISFHSRERESLHEVTETAKGLAEGNKTLRERRNSDFFCCSGFFLTLNQCIRTFSRSLLFTCWYPQGFLWLKPDGAVKMKLTGPPAYHSPEQSPVQSLYQSQVLLSYQPSVLLWLLWKRAQWHSPRPGERHQTSELHSKWCHCQPKGETQETRLGATRTARKQRPTVYKEVLLLYRMHQCIKHITFKCIRLQDWSRQYQGWTPLMSVTSPLLCVHPTKWHSRDDHFQQLCNAKGSML